MNLQNKYILFCALILIVMPVVLSTLTGKITATDWTYRHSHWIDKYLHGDFSTLLIYPPLFHFLMLPFVAINFPMIWFQVVFIILSTFGILYMAYKIENEKIAIFLSMLLATSIAYIQFASALMPQAFDFFFFSLGIVFYYKNKVKIVSFIAVMLFLFHLTGLLFSSMLLIHSILTKRYKFAKYMLVVSFILLIGVLYYHFSYYWFPTPYQWDFESQKIWESQYLEPFWNFFFFSGFLTWILLPYGCYKAYIEKYKLTDKQLLYIIWIIVFSILWILDKGIWRMVSFQIVPLSLLVSSLVSKDEKQEM